jgi:hypothetical protein
VTGARPRLTFALGLSLATTLAPASLGCAALRSITAANDDLADYRAFRVAAHEGTRLARAQRYLEAHPAGAWADEVRAIFEAEEPKFFEAASLSRDETREYLADLPRGPHAEAAVILLTAFDRRIEDEATARMLRDARRTESMLDRANAQRRAVGETILAFLAALLDENVYSAHSDDAPDPLRRALRGSGRPTWGALPLRREADLFFTLPTRPERESRLVTVAIATALRDGVFFEGTIEGADLFVRWSEADEMRPLDPTRDADRAEAAAHVQEILAGALEARFPARRCEATDPRVPTLVARACDDWAAAARMAGAAGGLDTITIRGPHRAKARETGRAAEK